MRELQLVLAIVFQLLVVGGIRQADPIVCHAIVLSPTAGLAIVASSSSFGGCRWPDQPIPVTYTLRRPQYVVYLRAFENNSGGIALMAEDTAGRPLQLLGDHFLDAFELEIPLSLYGREYRYWVLPAWLDREVLRFAVIRDADQLGNETLAFTVVNRIDFELGRRGSAPNNRMQATAGVSAVINSHVGRARRT